MLNDEITSSIKRMGGKLLGGDGFVSHFAFKSPQKAKDVYNVIKRQYPMTDFYTGDRILVVYKLKDNLMPKKSTAKEVKIESKEFAGNVLVTVSKHEVRLWVCNDKGQNIFRFKALGHICQGETDVMVMPSKYDL